MPNKTKTSFTLSPEALRLLEALAQHLGLSKAAVLELLIREAARDRKVEVAS